ncbi:unnamed protein product [Mytilus edulis]|uniref:Uncharacterized protein n=1 Tax=Mytilus edulis TaxID=6550 RepID=A0A8S3QC43_MYTED|nr:unnamed protein product [Mytilus edulis]
MSENKTESLQFYDYLCQKIGSKEVVRARRLLFISNDFGSYDIQISSGSRGEGLDLNGSDFDVMHIDPYYMVYESGKYAIEDQKCVLQLAMDTKESQPCFTYLLLLNNFDNLPQPFKQMFFQHNDDKILIGQLSFSEITFSANQKYDLTLMTQEKLISILKTKTIIKVIFKAKSSIIPTELKLDVRERPLNFEPVTFAHFLQFLCYFHLQDYTSCWFCILQLLQTIMKHASSKEKADYKMWITLGIAYQMLGLRDLAKTLFCQIAQNDKYNLTSAAFRLSRLS